MKLHLMPYEHGDLIPHGKIVTFELEMTPYPDGRRRLIRVWLPEEYDGERRFPVLYMHDGQGVFRCGDDKPKLDADRAVTSLRDEGFSAIVVAVDTAPTRGTELTPPLPRAEEGIVVHGFPVPRIPGESTTDLYADFIVHTLKPLIDENFRTLPDAAHTGIGGISAGGSCSYYMMLRHPEVFSRAIVFSPGFPMFTMEGLLEQLDGYDMERLSGHRFAFYNGDQGIDATSVDYVLAVYRKLKAAGFDNRHLMFLLDTRQAHTEAAWAKVLPEALRFLFLGEEE